MKQMRFLWAALLLSCLPALAADVAISGLPAASSVNGTDIYPTSQGATTRKATAAQMSTYVRGQVTKADVGLGNVDNTSNTTERAATATLTNKTISGASNTLTNIGISSLTSSAITINGFSVSLGGTASLTQIGAAGGGANNFTGNQQIDSAEPRYLFNATGGGTNGKLYDIDVTPTLFSIRTRTDANGAGISILAATRSASSTVITNVAFGDGNTTVTANGALTVQGNTLLQSRSIFSGTGGIASGNSAIGIASSTPTLEFNKTNAGADAKVWGYDASVANAFSIFLINDGRSAQTNALNLVRSGAALTSFNVGNTTDNNVTNILGTGQVNVGGKIAVASGFLPNAGGFKHARVTTGSVAAGSTALVTVTWGTTFADANYTATCSVLEATTSSLSVSMVHMETQSASALGVRVLNNAVGSLTGTLHCIAVHD